MKKQKLHDILPGTDLKHPAEIKKRIAEIEEAKTMLIYGVTNELEDNDERIFEPLKNLSMLQADLDSLMRNIESYEQTI